MVGGGARMERPRRLAGSALGASATPQASSGFPGGHAPGIGFAIMCI